MSFLLFVLATIGLTNIMVHGKIMELSGVKPLLRRLMKPDWFSLFECYECSGFWAGLICGPLILVSIHQWYLIPACGWAGSVLANTYNVFIFWLNSKIEFEIGEDNGPPAHEESV